ncbi:MAG: dihydroorotate dehydrogenase [Spirochaetes bacterium]|nr:dihydroorotate dehydrogenase [Spirochaetota bacterium]MCK5267652.1 dihydroorotate dehydrogenase [Spirochaetota bacterium]
MISVNTKVNLGSLELKNPVVLASGTCGYGEEIAEIYDPSILGAVTLKALSIEPRIGNPPPRVVEVSSGVLNAIGLQNVGYKAFIEDKIPMIKRIGFTAIANIAGNTSEDYAELCKRLNDLESIKAVELNVSCPNVKVGSMVFGQDHELLHDLVDKCRKACKKTLIVKLSPNVTDIVLMAKTCKDAGADALSLINTLIGMKIDIRTRRPVLANVTGGFSGPAIKPVAVRMVRSVYEAVDIPIIGMGGIMNWEDAVEFMLAGATAVGIGTANMIYPDAGKRILEGILDYMKNNGIEDINSIIGAMEK